LGVAGTGRNRIQFPLHFSQKILDFETLILSFQGG